VHLSLVQQQLFPLPVCHVEDGVGAAPAVNPVGTDLNHRGAKLLGADAPAPSGRSKNRINGSVKMKSRIVKKYILTWLETVQHKEGGYSFSGLGWTGFYGQKAELRG
jgi:hypothetical protein